MKANTASTRWISLPLAVLAAGERVHAAPQAPCASTLTCSVLPSDAIGPNSAGVRVACNAASTKIVIGSIGHAHGGGVVSGAAWVVSNPGTPSESEVEILPSTPSQGMFFSSSLAMNDVGDVLVVGAQGSGGTLHGAAFAYRLIGSAWVEEWHGAGIGNDSFGCAVSVSGSGDLLAVGASGRGFGFWGSNVGVVEVYRRGASGWTQEASLVPADAVNAENLGIGARTVMSRDGKAVAFSSGSAPGSTQPNGAVYVFRHNGTAWVEEAKLQEPVAYSGGSFGYSVAIDGVGDTVLAGNPTDSRLAYYQGAATVFRRGSNGWSYDDVLLPSIPVVSGGFGFWVAINSAGDRVLAGEPGASVSGQPSAGAVSEFEFTSSGWSLVALHGAPNPTSPTGFGRALCSSTTGRRCVVGEPGADVNGTNSGLVHVFDAPCLTPAVYCTAQTNSLGCVPQIAWLGQPSVSLLTRFTISAANARNQRSGLLFYSTSGRAALPWKGGTLCVQLPLSRTPLQSSAGTPPPAIDCSGTFAFDFNAWSSAQSDPALFAGQHVRAQYYSRDPGATFGVNLTDAVEFYLEP